MRYGIKNAIILNGYADMEPIYNKIIIIEDNKIVDICDEVKDDIKLIDLKNSYIMPGLINMHVHLVSDGKIKNRNNVKAVKQVTRSNFMRKIGVRNCYKNALQELYSGVTTIRTVGGIDNFDTLVRDKIKEKNIEGPRILASNTAITTKGGHVENIVSKVVETNNDVIDLMNYIIKDNPDLIKIMVTGGVFDAVKKGEPGVVRMNDEIINECTRLAHEKGLIVAAHVESTEGLIIALENGVDTIEHGAKVNDKIIELFKEKEVSLITTLSSALPYALFDQKISKVNDIEKYNGNIVFEGIVDCSKACLENKISVGLGTDSGCEYISHYNMWRELKYFHKFCNVSNKFALYTATLNNARIAKIDHLVGTIEVGKIADMIVSKKNPLDDLENLRYLKMVIKDGKIIKKKPKRIKSIDKELDKYM